MADKITRFHGDHDYLSNFYPSVVTWERVDYSTLEHAFQAAKTDDPDQRYQIQIAPTPAQARRAGRRVTLRPDWETVKFAIMENLVRQKFTRHPELGEKLLATGRAELTEGNTWHDRTYSAVWNAKKGQWTGKNFLGRTLMKVRDELNRQQDSTQR